MKVFWMQSIRQAIRRHIKHLRNEQGLTQEELSQECSYSPTYIGKVERGEEDISLEVMSRLAEALEVSPQELIQYQEGMDEVLPAPGPAMLSATPGFDYAFQNVDHVVGVTDEQGTVMLVNDTYSKYYEQTAEEAFGSPVWQLLIWEFRDDAEQTFKGAFRQVSEESGSHLYQLDLPHRDPAHLILSHLEDEEEDHLYVVFELLWPTSFPKGKTLLITRITRKSSW